MASALRHLAFRCVRSLRRAPALYRWLAACVMLLASLQPLLTPTPAYALSLTSSSSATLPSTSSGVAAAGAQGTATIVFGFDVAGGEQGTENFKDDDPPSLDHWTVTFPAGFDLTSSAATNRSASLSGSVAGSTLEYDIIVEGSA